MYQGAKLCAKCGENNCTGYCLLHTLLLSRTCLLLQTFLISRTCLLPPRNRVYDLLQQNYYNRGNTYHQKGELDQAITDYTEALNINLEYAEAYNNRGIAYRKKGELDQAIADANRALNINPESAKAYTNRGFAHYNLGDKQKAIQDFKKAAKLYAEQGDTANQQQILDLLKLWESVGF
ncbi:MAG: tetratricopeptide repeat protein [Symploca sp. SIO2D2]|nr:tetratricopeptide repeat protein [Symploca sp. SIO2D2]